MSLPLESENRSRNTRIALLQAFMPASMGQVDLDETREWMKERGYLENIEKSKFNRMLADVNEQLEELDQLFESFLKTRSLEELGHAERTILRVAAYELIETRVPTSVVINEWVAIAKDYGAESSYRFINGVLDNLARQKGNEEAR